MTNADRFDPLTARLEAEIVRRHVAGTSAAGICDEMHASGVATLDLWQVYEALARNGRHDVSEDDPSDGDRR